MGLEISGAGNLLRRLKRTGDRTTAKARRRLEKGANEIARRAEAYAPVETHDLESAISARKTQDGTFNGRVEWIVGVDVSRLDLGSRQGFDYAAQMHEAYPSDGPKTPEAAARRAAKEASIAGSLQGNVSTYNGMIVGGKYIERAFNDYEDAIREDIKQIMREAFKL